MRTGRLLAALLAGSVTAAAAGSTIALDPPSGGSFVLDRADLLSRQEEQAIDRECAALLDERAVALVVVTVGSMADHWPHGTIRIETFAQLLFDQWGVGSAELDGRAWNNGILLLVSRDDRKARIQLGGGWGAEYDERSRRIMDEEIIPEFKRGRHGAGIVLGVAALDAMARTGQPLPRAVERETQGTAAPSRGVSPGLPRAMPAAPLLGCFGMLVVILIVGGVLSRLGGGRRSGMGWGLGGFLGGLLLGNVMSRRTRTFGGGSRGFGGFGGGGSRRGGFGGGGSRGGGFSRGGGATGSW
jgi:uncharacterized protein